MLIVLSSLFDPHVTAGLEHFRKAGADVNLVTCHDLARPGWKATLDGEPTLVVDGERVPASRIRGVLTRLPWVTTHELPFVHPADREYAAAEMQAFLLAVLTQLECPVLNRATPGCLCGPSWSAERWTTAAAERGVEVRPIVRGAYAGGVIVDELEAPPRRVVHVVGDRVLGDMPRSFEDAALAVARAGGCDLLRVAFAANGREPVFLDADPLVDLTDPRVASAVLQAFGAGEGRR